MKTTITLLKTKLQAKLGGKIKYFYVGDPIMIPDSALPCISITPERTETNAADNARDSHNHIISIAIIINAKQYFNATPEKMVGSIFLMELMGNENADGTLNDATILDVLRKNLNLDTNRWIANISTIDYATRRRSEDLITLEAAVSITVQQIIIR